MAAWDTEIFQAVWLCSFTRKLDVRNITQDIAAGSRLGQRLTIKHLIDPLAISETRGTDVIAGLTQTPKTLPAKYFYDDRGSQLFEDICELPEYYPTRTETAILQEFAGQIAGMTGPCELIELGSGSSTKTRLLLDAYQELGGAMRYVPIDVSAGVLESSAEQLIADYSTLQVHCLVSTYELALAALPPTQLPTRTIAFLGSSLGNFPPDKCDTFFAQVTGALAEGEYFLLGIDLQKPKEVLEQAYDDSQGVTAAFNLNMLFHLNWRFGGNFDTGLFEHWAFYNPEQNQIEMHLRCLRSHSVRLDDLNLNVDFAAGETIHTEVSRKFELNAMQEYMSKQGLKTLKVWTDVKESFGLILCQLEPVN